MSTRIGLAIASDCVRALAVRNGVIRWAAAADRAAGESLSSTIGTLLQTAPSSRWRRRLFVAAVGPSAAQTKRLAGLPRLTDARVLAQVVREGAGRFFLRNDVPLITSSVQVVENGVAWAAAFEQPTVAEVETACRAAGARLRAIVPTVSVLGLALEEERVLWRDGVVAADLTLCAGRLEAARRSIVDKPVDSYPQDTPRVINALTTLGADGWRFADAYGAAVVPLDDALALRNVSSGSSEGRVSRPRRVAAGLAVALGATCALLAPGMSARLASRRAEARLSALGTKRREAAVQERELRRMTAALQEVARFDASRRSMTLLLAALTRALPAGGAIVTIRVDSAGGNIVALSPHGASLVSALERIPGMVSPEIFGPVTHEVIGGHELERLTMRFRFDPRGFELSVRETSTRPTAQRSGGRS